MSHKALGNCCIATGARSPGPVRVKNGREINALSLSQVPPKPAGRRTELERCQLYPQY
jgi:hypothetical protein